MSEEELQEEKDSEAIRSCLALVITESGISPYEVARRTKISYPSIRRWSNGEVEPKAASLARIERALQIPVGTIMAMAELVPDQKSLPTCRHCGSPKQEVKFQLATLKTLHPMYRRQAVETLLLWEKLSKQERSS